VLHFKLVTLVLFPFPCMCTKQVRALNAIEINKGM
jgi:hypothetical protein